MYLCVLKYFVSLTNETKRNMFFGPFVFFIIWSSIVREQNRKFYKFSQKRLRKKHFFCGFSFLKISFEKENSIIILITFIVIYYFKYSINNFCTSRIAGAYQIFTVEGMILHQINIIQYYIYINFLRMAKEAG